MMGIAEIMGRVRDPQETVVFFPGAGGFLTVWTPPRPEMDYVVGADCSLGVEGGDFSCAQVLSREPVDQVAEWHGLVKPHIFGQHVISLASWYNEAWLGVETNGEWGGSVINEVRGYPRLYKREVLNQQTQKVRREIGWNTTHGNRGFIFGELNKALDVEAEGGGYLVNNLHSKELLKEMRNMFYDKHSRPRHPVQGHDDRVMALGIALMVHQSPFCPRQVQKKRKRRSRDEIALEAELKLIYHQETPGDNEEPTWEVAPDD